MGIFNSKIDKETMEKFEKYERDLRNKRIYERKKGEENKLNNLLMEKYQNMYDECLNSSPEYLKDEKKLASDRCLFALNATIKLKHEIKRNGLYNTDYIYPHLYEKLKDE